MPHNIRRFVLLMSSNEGPPISVVNDIDGPPQTLNTSPKTFMDLESLSHPKQPLIAHVTAKITAQA
ncbi:hypothetical protein DSO57_1026212 [Entomophthora muscae]|uniref:Uncharacterized protein n=1 Tax=Entomophthora muscae TaxID=34485 RepID=A0ACC2T215_9FUNG|nr:hypothetical protein DSO57_1026212 [Entomophthora muscae]